MRTSRCLQLLPWAFAVGCAGAPAARRAAPPVVTAPPSAPSPSHVTIAHPMLGTIARTLMVPAELDFAARAEVTSRVAGVVATLFVDAGAAVRRGELVAELQPVRGPRVRVLSPIDGAVISRHVDVGAPVEAVRTSLMTLGTTTRLVARLQVPEAYATRLHVGQTVMLETPSRPDMRFDAMIQRVGLELTAAHTLPVEAPVANPDGGLRPGMTLTAAVVLEQHEQALIIPRSAVVRVGERAVVYVADDGHARAREVQTGIERGADVECVSGLTPDDPVIVSERPLTDGEPVVVDRE
jgi:multidrug efflux pump subunit AcrA (membrane-fusion protein)